MNLQLANSDARISSAALLSIINKYREENGENLIRNNDFSARIEDELSGDHYESFVVKNPNGTESKSFSLTHDQALLVGMRESKAVRKKVMEYIKHLSCDTKPALPATYKEALKALVAEVEAKEVLEQQLAIAAPKAQFVDKYVEATSGSMGFREVCKMLKAKESDFRNFLYSNKIMYKLNGTLTPFSKHLDAGRFEVKTGIADNEHTFKTAKFTAKGVEWVSKLWNKENAK